MPTFDVTVDAADALSYLQRLSRQVPYAVSKTLNDLANVVQAEERLELRRTFTIAPARLLFIERLIKRTKDDRATKENLVAAVRIEGSESRKKGSGDVLTRHLTPGTRTASSQALFFLPSAELRPGPYDVAPRAMYPKALRLMTMKGISGDLLSKAKGKRRKIAGLDTALKELRKAGLGGTFLIPGAGIFQRQGEGSAGLVKLWSFRRTITLRTRYPFYEIAGTVAKERWAELMERGFDDALKSAK